MVWCRTTSAHSTYFWHCPTTGFFGTASTFPFSLTSPILYGRRHVCLFLGLELASRPVLLRVTSTMNVRELPHMDSISGTNRHQHEPGPKRTRQSLPHARERLPPSSPAELGQCIAPVILPAADKQACSLIGVTPNFARWWLACFWRLKCKAASPQKEDAILHTGHLYGPCAKTSLRASSDQAH